MSKADVSTTPIRSRRAVLAGIVSAAAALPIAAAVPTAAMAPNAGAAGPAVVDPVIALAQSAIDAWNDFEEKCRISSDAEDLVIDWKKINPHPGMREAKRQIILVAAGLSTYDPNADLDAAIKEEEAAVKEWEKLRKSVEGETGYTRAERAQERASERFDDIRDELVYVRPTTIAGLRAKARAARVSSDEDLQQQIVFDVGVLLGDLDENEKPITAGEQA